MTTVTIAPKSKDALKKTTTTVRITQKGKDALKKATQPKSS